MMLGYDVLHSAQTSNSFRTLGEVNATYGKFLGETTHLFIGLPLLMSSILFTDSTSLLGTIIQFIDAVTLQAGNKIELYMPTVAKHRIASGAVEFKLCNS